MDTMRYAYALPLVGLLLCAVGSPAVAAVDGTWNASATTDWNTGANWNSSPNYPNGQGDIARLRYNLTTKSPNVSSSVTVGTIEALNNGVNGSFTITASAGQHITLDDTDGEAEIKSDLYTAPQLVITAPLVLNVPLKLTIVSGTARYMSLNGNISGGQPLTCNGVGFFKMSGSNTFANPLFVYDGALQINNGAGYAIGGVTNIVVGGGANSPTLSCQGNNQIDDRASITVKNGATFDGPNTETVKDLTFQSGGKYTRGTGSSQVSFTGTLTVSGGARLSLANGGSSASGGLTFSGASATFAHDGLGTAPALFTSTLTGPGVDYGAGRFRLGSTTRTWTINDSAAPYEVDFRVQVIDAGGIIKTGDGTVRLGYWLGNTYSGGTTVNAGAIWACCTNYSSTGTGFVTVNAGGTLGGDGYVAPNAGNNVTINGTLSPGTNNAARMTFNLSGASKLGFGAGSTVAFDAGTASDLVTFATAGDWLIGSGNATLAVTQGPGFNTASSYTVFTNVTTTGFTFASITGGPIGYVPSLTMAGNQYVLSFAHEPAKRTLIETR